jgi:hypothetical protein
VVTILGKSGVIMDSFNGEPPKGAFEILNTVSSEVAKERGCAGGLAIGTISAMLINQRVSVG